MSETKQEQTPESQIPILNDVQRGVLIDEAARMQTLYLDARNSSQNVFNFYLTFVTAVIGGIVFVSQNSPDNPVLNSLTLIALLFFAVMVGSVYTGALSARYADMGRYAHALDLLRREVLKASQAPLPDAYKTFMSIEERTAPPVKWWEWLVPTGSFQLFMAFVNSASMSLILFLLLRLGSVDFVTLFSWVMIMFFIMMTIFNVYSRIVIQRFTRQLDVRIDMRQNLTMWAYSRM